MTDRLLPAALLDQRRALRRRLQAQRQLVVSQFEPLPIKQRYRPRSKSMRFLTQQPALAAGLLATVATLVIGVRFLRALTALLTVTRLLSSVSDRAAQIEVSSAETGQPEPFLQDTPVRDTDSRGDHFQAESAATPSTADSVMLDNSMKP